MGSLLVVVPVICCLLIPAVIGVAAFVFRGSGKQSPDKDGRKENLTHSIERDLLK